MSFNSTPYKPRPPPGQRGSTPFRSSSASKFRSSLVPSSRPSPARTLNPSTKLSETPSSARDLFRTSTPRGQRTPQFAPELPAAAVRQNASVRKFAPHRSVSSGMANTASTEPFKLRIPSPDPELTGEVLAKKIPNDPSRKNSFADQFLADLCPPEFDDLQRRQFFCVLDLRRLKYAANEIFAKKDWKLNILNFAKEFEKSRGLIMLRYGLYEFKNVRPSTEVLKKWRAAHNLPDIEDDASGSRNPQNVSSARSMKRKADDELAPKDNTLMNSTANQNKRRNVDHGVNDPFLASPAPFKNKRKVGDTGEPDENQPNKLHKPAQSSATSIFASIINKPRDTTTSPSKESAQTSTSFGVSKPKDSQDTGFATKANPFQQPSNNLLFSSAKSNKYGTSAESVLSSQNVGTTAPTTSRNIFSYQPGSPGSSSDSDDDDEDDAGVSENEPKKRRVSEEERPSAAANTGTSTPVQNGKSIFAAGTKGTVSNPFAVSTTPAAQTPKGGLFGRVQLGTNGKPVRAPFGDEKRDSSAVQQSTPVAVKPPGDYTFNPATTPISFGQSASATTPVSTAPVDAESRAKPATTGPAQTEKPTSIFNTNTQATPASKPNIFGTPATNKPKSSDASTSIFGSQKPAASSSNIFGASTTTGSVFGVKDQPKQTTVTSTSEQVPSIFNKAATDTPADAGKKSPAAIVDDKGSSSVPASKNEPRSIFDQSFIDESVAQRKAAKSSDEIKASPNIFSRSANPLFGGSQSNGTAAASTKSVFGQADKPASTAPASDASPAVGTKSIFGQTNNPASTAPAANVTTVGGSKSIFGQANNPASTAPEANVTTVGGSKSIFGQTNNPASTAPASNGTTAVGSKSIFGQTNNTASPAPASNGTTAVGSKSIFGQIDKQTPAALASNTSQPEAQKEGEKAGNATAFGLKPAAAPTTSMFGSQGSAMPTTSVSATPFGGAKSGGPAEPAKPTPSTFGSTSTAKTPSFGFGFQPASNANTQSPSITFGANATDSGVSFGSSSFQTNASEPKKADIQFGSPAPSAKSTPYAFGQDSSSSGTGFSFTAGGGTQAVNNPFATSKTSSQTAAPAFGANSFTSTPSSSFNFTFQGQPATSKATPSSQGSSIFASMGTSNGAPSFNFTQATPSQNTPVATAGKPSAPMSVFGHLQASGDASAGASSPFPAPSSIGTTPVNGSPEPQAPNENGEEASHEQLSLTEGGPGEEDETVVHEVRAKAVKYVPVQKGDDEDDKKSPWTTQGVGPLRILKNKTTGTVRMLLRAEPRGHIALNKALLPDVEYKAKEKTINFVASKDDGSGLETWVLQVKKPEFARELVSVLEANKTANKK